MAQERQNQGQQNVNLVVTHKSSTSTTVIKLLVILLLLVILAPVLFGILFTGCGIMGCLGLGGVAALHQAVEEAEKPAKETQLTQVTEAVRAQTAKYNKRETLRQSVRRTDERLQAISEEFSTLRKEFDKLVASGEYEKAEKVKAKQLALNAETERLTERRKQLQGNLEIAEADFKAQQAETRRLQARAEQEKEKAAN